MRTGPTEFLVVSYLGGWRIRHGKWQSKRYHTQADAVKVALEMARGVKDARVLLALDAGRIVLVKSKEADRDPS